MGESNFDSIYDHNNDYFKTTGNVYVPMHKYHTAKKGMTLNIPV